MAQVSGSKTYNTFIAGMITEASPLTFPENASIDEANCSLNRNGLRQRRLGIDFEVGHSLINTLETSSTFDAYATSYARWDNPGNKSGISIGVVQVRNKLWFLDLYSNSPSSSLLNDELPLTIPGAIGKEEFQYASVNGVLVVVSSEIDPIYLEYDSILDSVSFTEISIKIRDIFGVDDGLDILENPNNLTDAHRYNLRNQGWDDKKITYYKNYYGNYPNNTQIWHLAKSSLNNFLPSKFSEIDIGNTPAPKGRFIIDAYDRGGSRTSQSGLTLPTDKESGKLSTATSFAGRIFYAGVKSSTEGTDGKSPNYSGFIFYSPVIDTNDKLGNCYQEADPTSEFVSDLVDTDGGFVPIPEANQIYKLESTQDSVFVFAENGIWVITGSTKGFVATEYEVKKITSIGVEGAGSITLAEDVIYYWSKGGIYRTQRDQVSNEWTTVNISEERIQSYFTSIAPIARKYCKGNYDPISKKISWLFNNSANYDGIDLRNKYNSELYLDTSLGSFFPYYIEETNSNSPFVAGYLTTPNFLLSETINTVLVGSDTVVVSSDTVTETEQYQTDNDSITRYITFIPTATSYRMTLSYYRNSLFKDWITHDMSGADYSSYLITGYELAGDIMRNKQVPYIFFYFNRTEDGFDVDMDLENPSSCFVQSRWDWTGSASSGKWGTPFQAYRFKRNYIATGPEDNFDYGYDVIVTKSKLRGRGRALSLKIYSETGKDFQLLGWAMPITGGSSV